MTTYRVTLAYDGTAYHGWQVQAAREVATIQGTLESALFSLTQRSVRVAGSGRTDRGVHARGQVASFSLPKSSWTARALQRALNAALPHDIRVMALRRAPDGFHARTWALKKRYVYTVETARVLSPFENRFALHSPYDFDYAKMNRMLAMLRGTHDFTSFQGAGSRVRGTVRRLFRASVKCDKKRMLIALEADGFLRHMVRNIVGTLLDLGRRKGSPKKMRDILDSRDRRAAGPTAPPQGLCLVKVSYGLSRSR